ncbi:MAG: hypothetical protein A2Z88_02450 [Omnitrophica WOR_2 bacterium GWA2_47_8]|nr:MAG: hypothetical protein A2Z88_02450 [Omnitrophica WOR_2 bacterium GWA2_47_8]
MSKHHHQSREEQIYNKAHGAVPFHYEKMSYKASESLKSEDFPPKAILTHKSKELGGQGAKLERI